MGQDKFWIATGELVTTPNTITDFTVGQDTLAIAFSGVTSVNDLTLSGQTIAIGAQVIATLTGINTTALDASNFEFA